MSQTITHIVGFFIGITVAELTVAHAGPMAFFHIPFTKRLIRERAVDDGKDILKAYRGVVLVLGVVYSIAFGVVLLVFPRILPGFIVGSVVLIAVRFRGWGYTLRNFDEYVRSHAPSLKNDEEGPGESGGKKITAPKEPGTVTESGERGEKGL